MENKQELNLTDGRPPSVHAVLYVIIVHIMSSRR